MTEEVPDITGDGFVDDTRPLTERTLDEVYGTFGPLQAFDQFIDRLLTAAGFEKDEEGVYSQFENLDQIEHTLTPLITAGTYL